MSRLDRAVSLVVMLAATAMSLQVAHAQSADLKQGANDSGSNGVGNVQWTTSNLTASNSVYCEQMSTPQRLILYGYGTSSSNYSLTLSHQATRNNVHAYDFLTSWAQAVSAADAVAPGQNLLAQLFANQCGASIPSSVASACASIHASSNFVDVSIPDNLTAVGGASGNDNIANRIAAYEAVFGDRKLRIWGNAPITAAGMSFTGYSGSSTKRANYDLTWTTTATVVIIEYGSHLAVSGNGSGFSYAGGYGSASIGSNTIYTKASDFSAGSIGTPTVFLDGSSICITCSISGDPTVDCGTTNTYSVAPITGATYQWSLLNNNTAATIVGSSTGSSVQVNAGTGCNATHKVRCVTTFAGQSTTCDLVVTVSDATAPVITCPPNVTIPCGSTLAPSLPATGTATISVKYAYPGAPSYFWTTITNAGLLNGSYIGWCVDTDLTISQGQNYTNVVYYTDYSLIPSGFLENPQNLDLVNWILNQGFVGQNSTGGFGAFTYGDVQRAIWSLIDNQNLTNGLGDWNQNRVNQILAAANANGEGFVPVCGQVFAVILAPVNGAGSPTNQITIVTAPVGCTPTATDPCGQVNLTYTDVATGTCPTVVTRTWTASDGCGNSSTCVQTITIVDTTPPAALTKNVTAVMPPTGLYTITTSQVNNGSWDNCGGVTVSISPSIFTCANIGVNVVTVTVVDDCGNVATNTATVTLNDPTPPTISCPPASTVGCSGLVPPPASNLAEFQAQGGNAGDDCSVSVVHLGDVVTNQTCANRYTISRTYQASDGAGNLASCTQTITVLDNVGPAINGVGTSATINCPAAPVFSTPTASDVCGTASLTFSDVTTPGACASAYSVTRTWTATDACGNTSTASQTINVVDTTAPTISSLPSATTVECPSQPSFAAPTASDACGTANLTFSDVTTPGACASAYSVTRTWTATDACGNTSTASQTINVVDTTAPTIVGVGAPLSGDCTSVPSFSVPTANDACGTATLTFNDVTLPGNCAGSYTITRTWTAADACGNQATASQSVTVGDTTAPVIAGVGSSQSIECPATPDFSSPTATDACSAASLTFQDVTTPGTCSGTYSVTRTWTATDACGNASTASQTIAVVDTTAPTIACPPNTTLNCGSTLSPTIPAFGTATISVHYAYPGASSYFWTTVTNGGLLNGAYFGWCVDTDLTINQNQNYSNVNFYSDYGLIPTGFIEHPENLDLVNWILNQGFVGQVSTGGHGTFTYGDVQRAIWTLIDDQNLTNGLGSWNQNRVDQILALATLSGEGFSPTCGQLIGVILAPVDGAGIAVNQITLIAVPVGCTATATDACGSATLTYTDSMTGSCPTIVTRIWTATDPCGNASSCQQTITVVDTTPPAALTKNITVNLNAGGIVTITASQVNNGSWDGCGGVTLSVVPSAFTCADVGPNTVTLTVIDDCGNVSTNTATVTVNDPTPPTISCPPAVTVECSTAVPAPAVDFASFTSQGGSSSDNCAVTIAHLGDVVSNETCADSFTITRTYQAIDSIGNISTCSQTILVADTTAPTISTLPAPVTVECPVTPDFATPTANDDCGTANMTFNDVTKPGACANAYSVTRTWTATDACGNASTASQTISVVDTTAPIITNVGAAQTIEFPATPVFSTPSATDACGPANLTFNDVTAPGTCVGSYSVTRTWTATDACGNPATASQTISVVDTTPPVISCPSNVTVECPAVIDPQTGGTATAVDLADPSVVVTPSDVTISSCGNASVIERTWTATDACGNVSTCVQILTVADTTAPTIVSPAPIVVCAGNCDGEVPDYSTTVITSDACGTVTVTQNPAAGTPVTLAQGTVNVVLYATDACGNVSTATTSVTASTSYASVVELGGQCGGPNNTPLIHVTLPVLDSTVKVAVINGSPNEVLYFVANTAPFVAPTPFGGVGAGCVLNVDPYAGLLIGPEYTSPVGDWSIQAYMPPLPFLAGVQVRFQAAVVGIGGPLIRLQVSNTVEVTLGACSPYCTYTATDYSGTGAAGVLFDANFETVFPSGLEVGLYDIASGNAQPNGVRWEGNAAGRTALKTFLASTPGANGALATDEINPTSIAVGADLAKETAVLKLNIAFSAAGLLPGPGLDFGTFVYLNVGAADSLYGLTLNQIAMIASQSLEAVENLPVGYTYASLTALLGNLNASFENCAMSGFAGEFMFR